MGNQLIIPPALKRGDTIGIIAPAGQISDPQRFEQGLQLLHELGYQVKFPRDMWPGEHYLADTDSRRIAELHRMFTDTEVKAIFCARGGFGCLRLIEQLDYAIIRKHPKLFIGFSDITILLSQLHYRANMLCFHGPVITSLAGSDTETLERLNQCLRGNWRKNISWENPEILRGGDTRSGKLVGGNLSSILTLAGTEHFPLKEGDIVILEDVHEPLYKIDRLLTQLRLTSIFKRLGGIILGEFIVNQHQEPLEKLRYTENIWNRVLELTAGTNIPVWGNFPVGHGQKNLTFPYGAEVIMDSNSASIRFNV